MPLTAAQTLDMLADLASGALNDVFTQIELDRFYERAGEDYNLAVYYGWREIAGNRAAWVNYRVAQTEVDRGDAFAHILEMLKLWGNEARTNANQLQILGMRPVPTSNKPHPTDDLNYPGWPRRWSRWRY